MKRAGKATRKIWGTVVGRLVQRVATVVICGIHTSTLQEQVRRGRVPYLLEPLVERQMIERALPLCGDNVKTDRLHFCVRAESRGGNGEGILGWSRKAISAYTWCVTERRPQRKWLHKIKKKGTPECHCHRDQEQPPEQSGEHLVEGCRLLAEARELVKRKEMREWRTRQPTNRWKKKGPVEPEKEKAFLLSPVRIP